jgi:ribonuclease BN (tRNA processing enzyme)
MSRPGRPELVVRVNGHHAAWPSKFGASGPRDTEVRRSPYRVANASASLLLRRDGEALYHALVDAGLGVINSLLELQQSAGVDRVDAVLLTHPHFDHIAGLDWLLASCSRSTVPGQPWPLPVYCTEAACEAVFGRHGLFHWWRKSIEFRPLRPGEPVVLAEPAGAKLTASAVPVEHGVTAPGAAILGIDFSDGRQARRIGIAWDMLRLLPDSDPSPLDGCDLLFVDSTTVHPQPEPKRRKWHRNWHISVEESLPLTAAWAPKRTYLIHYSGSHDEDPRPHDCIVPEVTRALTHYELQELASRLGDRFERDLRVADHGLTVPDHEPWPD